jgi:nitrogen fixation-related uncharacterized protein
MEISLIFASIVIFVVIVVASWAVKSGHIDANA